MTVNHDEKTTTGEVAAGNDLPVTTHDEGAVRVIQMRRPHRLNAMNVQLLDGLIDAFSDLDGCRAVVLHGEGRAFCVGEDLTDTLAPTTGDAEELRSSFDKLQELTRLMTRTRRPIVAAVQGHAVGGGAELALCADFIIAAPDLQLRFPEVELGHAVTGGISLRLPATVGLVRAKDLLLSSRWIASGELLEWGMVTEIAENPLKRGLALAHDLASRASRSMGITKQGIELAATPLQDSVLHAETMGALHCFASPEAAEAFAPFQTREE